MQHLIYEDAKKALMFENKCRQTQEIRTGLVSDVKFSGLPAALHSFNSCACLIQVLFSAPESRLVAFILRGIRAVWMVSLANVTQAALWHFSTTLWVLGMITAYSCAAPISKGVL